MREVNEGSTATLRVLNAELLCANSLVAWERKKKRETIPCPAF